MARAGHDRFHDGNSTGSAGGIWPGGACSSKARREAMSRASANLPSSIGALKGVLERDHQLHAVERAQAELFDRRVRRQILAPGILRNQRGQAIGARLDEARGASLNDPVAHDGSLQLPRSFGARQLALRPHQRAADLLLIFELGVGLPDDRVEIGALVEDEDRVHPLLRADPRADHGCITDAGRPQQHPLDVFRKDVEALRRDDHLLLAAADVNLFVLGDLADVAGVKPTVLEGAGRFFVRVEVAAGHVVPPDEDLAVRRNLHLHAGNGLPYRSLLRAERVVQADDRRGLSETVALDHDEAELGPERLEVAVERRRADDERPELPAEQSVDRAVPPPAPEEMLPRAGHIGMGYDTQDMLAQHVQDLRHGNEHRDTALLDLCGDLARVVPAHEDDVPRQHGGNEGGHCLAEHVAERQEVQKANRRKWPAPLAVLHDFAFDRNDVREYIAVGDDDAFGLGSRAGREDDLRHVVGRQRNVRCPGRRTCGPLCPVQLVQLPDGDARRIAARDRRDVLTDQHELRRDDAADARQEVRRRAIVDRHDDDAA